MYTYLDEIVEEIALHKEEARQKFLSRIGIAIALLGCSYFIIRALVTFIYHV